MRKFVEAFAPYGLTEAAIKPSYGMAEATLFVSTTDMKVGPTVIRVDRDELNKGRLVKVAEDSPTGCRRCPADESPMTSGRPSSTPTPPRNCLTGTSARSGCTATTWVPATGSASRRPRDLSEHPQVAHQPVACRRCARRRDVDAHRRPRRLPRRRVLHHRPDQGAGDHRRPQSLPAGSRAHRAGGHPRAAPGLRGGVLSAGQPVAAAGVRQPARWAEVRPGEHVRAAGDRRRARPGHPQARPRADRRRHPCRDRGAPRRHGARRTADAGGHDPAHVQRQDRPPGLPYRLHRRQPPWRDRLHQFLSRRRGLASAQARLEHD